MVLVVRLKTEPIKAQKPTALCYWDNPSANFRVQVFVEQQEPDRAVYDIKIRL